jgi:hypothetical protein
VKSLLALMVVVALLIAHAFPHQGTKPIPPGIRAADKQPGPADIPPQTERAVRRLDPALLQAQARELSVLAQTIPDAINQVNTGTLPKDMNEKLKRIEKLSKALRGEIGN